MEKDAAEGESEKNFLPKKENHTAASPLATGNHEQMFLELEEAEAEIDAMHESFSIGKKNEEKEERNELKKTEKTIKDNGLRLTTMKKEISQLELKKKDKLEQSIFQSINALAAAMQTTG